MAFSKNEKMPEMFVVKSTDETNHRQKLISGEMPEAYIEACGKQLKVEDTTRSELRNSLVGKK